MISMSLPVFQDALRHHCLPKHFLRKKIPNQPIFGTNTHLSTMKSTISLILFLFCITSLSAQVLSVDRENGQDSIQNKVAFTWTSGVTLDKQKNNILEIETAEELDAFLKNNQVLILLGNTALQTYGASILENNGYFMFRLRDNDKKRVSPDYYAQLQWNGI
jgi:Na+/melibiose symporter-like transporter